MLAPLPDVVAAELRRVDVPGRALRGKALPGLPVPRLRRLGRELDTSASLLPAVLDGETPVLIRCLLDLTAVYQYLDGERGVAAVERLSVEPADVRWGVAAPEQGSVLRPAPSADAAARGREHAARSRASRKPPPGMIGMTEAANLSGVPVGTIRNALDRGELPVAHASPEGYRFMRPADIVAWARTRRRPGMKKTPATMTATGA